MKKERILPPNCKEYYQQLGTCQPDDFCSRIRNPAQYAIKHTKLGERGGRRRKATAQQGDAGGGAEAGASGLVQVRKSKVQKEQKPKEE